jgi:hypothetical protein
MQRALLSILLGSLFLTATAGAQNVQLLSPDISFTAKEVFFRVPVLYLGADQKPHKTRVALKLLLQGENFYDAATGPHYYLGKLAANTHHTSPDGKMVAVYFYDPVRIPRKTPLRIQTRTDEFVTLKQTFELEKVRWLTPKIRTRRKLPDLRARLLGTKPG